MASIRKQNAAAICDLGPQFMYIWELKQTDLPY